MSVQIGKSVSECYASQYQKQIYKIYHINQDNVDVCCYVVEAQASPTKEECIAVVEHFGNGYDDSDRFNVCAADVVSIGYTT